MRAREQRRKVLIRAKVRAGGLPIDACIRDISSKGLMIQAKVPPPRGTYVEIVTPSHTIVGRVVWGRDMKFGISTQDKLHIDMIVGERREPNAPAAPDPRLNAAFTPAQPRAAAFRRSHAKALEFAALILFGLMMVGALGMASYQTLAQPFSSVAERLQGLD
jgi:hypothetical protein